MDHWHTIHRAAKLLLFTAASAIAAYMLAYLLRFEFSLRDQVPQVTIWVGLACLILSRLAAYAVFRATNLTWRYFSLAEFIPLLKAHAVSTVGFLALVLLLRLPDFPRSIAIIEFILSLFFNVAAALSIRLLFERRLYPLRNRKQRENDTIIIGAGASGHLLVKTLFSQPQTSFNPVGVLDDAARNVNTMVHGVPVLGSIAELQTILERDSSIKTVALAIPSLSAARARDIEEICRKHGVSFHRLQSFENLALENIGSDPSEIPIDLILKREPQTEYEEELRKAYEGKTILVTGGAGSIGSEAVRQLALLAPQSIIVVDNSEYHLFELERELGDLQSDADVDFLLLDITDQERLAHVFDTFQPDIVLHTAAYKHVPLAECNPYSAFRTNVFGTQIVAELCLQKSVNQFILLSTDKAVEPANIMGCTKRIAELITQEIMCDRDESLCAGIVRFGNVVNSRGSVIPLFIKQIQAGGPLTVTHPEIERFFMSVQEAVRLMLVAATLARNGEIFILDMGTKLRIKDVAEEMLRITGREDIPIVFSGLRPGEKLTEKLHFSHEILQPTTYKKINMLPNTTNAQAGYVQRLAALREHLPSLNEEELNVKIRELLE